MYLDSVKTSTPKPSLPVPPDGPLQSWATSAESVALLMHPFMRLPGIHPQDFVSPQKLRTKLQPTAYELTEMLSSSRNSRSRASNIYPSWSLLKRLATPVSWSQVASETNLSLHHIAIGLLTSIGAVGSRWQNNQMADKLEKYADACGLFYPTEGDIPPLLEAHLEAALNKIGIDHLHAVDEFGTHQRIVPASEFSSEKAVMADTPCHSRLVSTSIDVIVASHWDSFWTVVAGPRRFVTDLAVHKEFDAVIATSDTTNAWWA